MTAHRKYLAIGLATFGTLALGIGPGIGTADAAPMPTLAVTSSGDTDWQITYDRGSSAKRTTVCRAYLDDRRLDTPVPRPAHAEAAAAPEATPPAITSLTLRGARVTPGAHRIHVRCGRSVSPTIWLIAPRNQIFDGLTWLSNGTAGVFGY